MFAELSSNNHVFTPDLEEKEGSDEQRCRAVVRIKADEASFPIDLYMDLLQVDTA